VRNLEDCLAVRPILLSQSFRFYSNPVARAEAAAAESGTAKSAERLRKRAENSGRPSPAGCRRADVDPRCRCSLRRQSFANKQIMPKGFCTTQF
jgi:hypothetical protein